MNKKEKIMNYFRRYWRSNLFMKSVSVLVAVCFVINVANLPVYAQSGRVEDELLNKRIENHAEKQEAATNPAVMRPVNEQIGSVVNIEGLDAVSRKELDRKDMAVSEIGAILERSRDGSKERIVGSYDDEKKKINIHTQDSSRNYSKEVKADYEFRALQVLDSGAKRGSFVETHSKEFLKSEAARGISGKGEEREEKQGFEKGLGKYDEEEEGIETGIKESEAEEKVYRESDEVIERKVNEESVESKHNALKALIKEKETASVTKVTIEKIQETASKSGLELVAKKDAVGNETRIELYSSKFTGENIFVAKSGGQMAYPTHNGSVEIKQSKDKINIGGNEFEKTGISLVSGEKAHQDNSINRKAEGLFIKEMLSVFSGEGVLGLEKRASVSVSERASSALVKTLDGINKGVLAGQSLFAGASVKAVKGSFKVAGLKEGDKGEEKNKDYEDVAEELAKQSGLSREEVDKTLGVIEKSNLDNAIGLLKDFFAHGGQIINCASDAISNILGGRIGKGVIALQALSNDIASGVFGKESIKDGQIYTSMSSMNKVLKDNGKESAGYGISLEDFKSGLNEGESGILWVDGNHYVTVTKEKEGKYSVADVNRNDGEKITYSGEEFDKLLSGKESVDVDGVTRVGYQVDANDMKVLTDSEGIKEKASEGKARALSEEQMKAVTGAGLFTKIGSAIKRAISGRSRSGSESRSERRRERSSSSGRDRGPRYSHRDRDDWSRYSRRSPSSSYFAPKRYLPEVKRHSNPIVSFAKKAASWASSILRKSSERYSRRDYVPNRSYTAGNYFKPKIFSTAARMLSSFAFGGSSVNSPYRNMFLKQQRMGVMAKKPYRMNSPLKTLGQMLINRLGGFMGNTAKSGTSLLAGSLQSVPKQRGIVFNADTNTVTNYGSGKSEKILHLQGDVDQDKINELVAGKNYERIVNYAKHNGNFKSETLLDVSGKEIYSAVNVGQNGKGIVAVQYNFRQDYSNDTTISGAKAGEQKVIVEEYNDEKSEYSVSRAMTYSSNKTGSVTKQTTQDGVEVTANIGSLERVTEFESKTIEYNGKSETIRVARSVDFKGLGSDAGFILEGRDSEGNLISGGIKPSGFEEAMIMPDGTVNVTRYDLTEAVSDGKLPAKEGAANGGGERELTLVDKYAEILKLTGNLKFKDRDALYQGYERVSNDYIDMSKVATYSYSTASPDIVNKHISGDGKETIVTAKFLGKDWRYERHIIADHPSNSVTIRTKNDLGGIDVEKYAGAAVNGKFEYDISNSGREWYKTDNLNNVTEGGMEYKAGQAILMAASDDLIVLDKDVNFTYKRDNVKGGFNIINPEGSFVSGTYINNKRGGGFAQGIVDGKFEITEGGLPSLEGKVIINEGESFHVGKGQSAPGKAGEDDGVKNIPDASDTNAAVIENEDGYSVSDGSISLRNGGLVVMGKGAVFKTGSDLFSIGGKLTEGELKADVDGSGNYSFKSVSATARVEGSDGNMLTATRYDTEGIVRSYMENLETGASMLTEYKEYDAATGTYKPNAYGSPKITIKTVREGDTGFGYTVEKLGRDGKFVLQMHPDGKVSLTEGAKAYKEIVENSLGENAGGKIVFAYEGLSGGETYIGYELRENGNNVKIQTDNGKTFYGFKGDSLIEINLAGLDAEGNPEKAGEYFSVGLAEGFAYDEKTKTYSKKIEDKNSIKNLFILRETQNEMLLSSKLAAFKLDGVVYKAEDTISLPGGGLIVSGSTKDYPIYVTMKEDGSFRYLNAEGDKIKDFLLKRENNQWYIYSSRDTGIAGESGLSGNLGTRFSLSSIKDSEGNHKFVVRTLENKNVTYKNPDGGKTGVTINAGAQILFVEGGAVVAQGKLTVGKKAIVLPAQTSQTNKDNAGEEKNLLPDATDTNAVIKELQNGGYSVSSGTLSIRNGNLVAYGKGATYKNGSEIAGQKVVSGSITLADFRTVEINGAAREMPVFVGANGGYAETVMGGAVTVKYNGSGVTSASAGGGRTSSGTLFTKVGGQYQVITNITNVYGTEKFVGADGKEYRVLSYSANGNLVLASTKKSSYTHWLKTDARAIAEKKYLEASAELEAYYQRTVGTNFNVGDNQIMRSRAYREYKNAENALKAEIVASSGLSDVRIKKLGYVSVDDFMKKSYISGNMTDGFSVVGVKSYYPGASEQKKILINSIKAASDGKIASIDQNQFLRTRVIVSDAGISMQLEGQKRAAYGENGEHSADNAVSAAMYDQNFNEPPSSGFLFNAAFMFQPDENGVLSDKLIFSSGEFTANMKNFAVNYPPSPSSGGLSGTGGVPSPAAAPINTQGIINQSDPNYMTISGHGSVISIRNGEYVGVGNGTAAWAGSTFRTFDGSTVTSLTGTQTYSDGMWVGSEDATYRFNDPASIAKSTKVYFDGIGFTTGALDFTRDMKGSIPMTAYQAGIAASAERKLKLTAGANGGTLPDGTKIAAGGIVHAAYESMPYNTASDGKKIAQQIIFRAGADGTQASAVAIAGFSSDKDLKASFNKGEAVSFEAVLGKSGAILTQTEDLVWNDKNITAGTIKLKSEFDTADNKYHLALAGNGKTVNVATGKQSYDPAGGGVYNEYKKEELSGLSGKFGEYEYEILAGAKVAIHDGKIEVLKARAYTANMLIGNGKGVGGDPAGGSSDAYFEGSAIAYTADGIVRDKTVINENNPITHWMASGVFNNYSDAASGNTFSKNTLFANNSRLDSGSYHEEFGKISGSARIFEYETVDENGNKIKRTSLKAEGNYAGSVRWTDAHNRFSYEFDSSGITSARRITSYNAGETVANGDFGGNYDGYNVDRYSDQKVFFQTENVGGVNVMMMKDGSYVQAGTDGEPMTGDDGDRVAKVEINFNFSYKGKPVTGADGNDYRVQDTVRITSGAATNYMVKTGSDHKMRILKTKNGQDAELGRGDYITQRSSDNKNIIYINGAELMFVNGKNETLYKGAKGEVWSVAYSKYAESKQKSLHVKYNNQHWEFLNDGSHYINGNLVDQQGYSATGEAGKPDKNERTVISGFSYDKNNFVYITKDNDGKKTIYTGTGSNIWDITGTTNEMPKFIYNQGIATSTSDGKLFINTPDGNWTHVERRGADSAGNPIYAVHVKYQEENQELNGWNNFWAWAPWETKYDRVKADENLQFEAFTLKEGKDGKYEAVQIADQEGIFDVSGIRIDYSKAKGFTAAEGQTTSFGSGTVNIKGDDGLIHSRKIDDIAMKVVVDGNKQVVFTDSGNVQLDLADKDKKVAYELTYESYVKEVDEYNKRLDIAERRGSYYAGSSQHKEKLSREDYEKTPTVRTKSIELSDIMFNGNFANGTDADGKAVNVNMNYNIGSAEYDITNNAFVYNDVVFTYNSGKNNNVNLYMTGDVNVPPSPPAGEEGEQPASTETEERLYDIIAHIEGNKLTFNAKDPSRDIKFVGSFTSNAKPGEKADPAKVRFTEFLAGTTLTFSETSHLKSINSNSREVNNSNMDLGTVDRQVLSAVAEKGGEVFLKKNTKFCDLIAAIAENGVEKGTVIITNEFHFSNRPPLAVRGVINAGENWESSTKTLSQFKDGVWTQVQDNASILGGTYKDGKINFGFWNGTLDLNKSVTGFEIQKNGFVRGVEILGGVGKSIEGIYEGIFRSAVWIADALIGKNSYGSYASFAWGAQNNALRTAASLMSDIKESNVTDGKAASAVFAGVAAVAAAAVAVAGIISSPFTAGASAVGGVALAGFIIGAAVGTTIAVVGAAKSAFDASENFQLYAATGNAAYLKVGLINLCFSLFSIATAGMAANFGNAGAKLGAMLTGKGGAYAAGVAAAQHAVGISAREAAKQAVATNLARAASGSVAGEIAKTTFIGALKESAKAAGMSLRKYVATSSWAIRGYILGGSSLANFGFETAGVKANWFTDIVHLFSIQSIFGKGIGFSENSWATKEIFGKGTGLTWGSIVWLAGYTAGARMASGAVRGTLSNPSAANSAGLSGKGSVAKGFKESAANIGKLVGRGGLQSGSRLTGAVNAWGSLGMNTYRMATLNIGMGFTGKLLRTSGVLNALDNGSALGGLVNFVFGEMGAAKGANGEMAELGWGEIVTNAFSTESLAQSAMFGTIMYAFMPVVSGFADKISGGRLAQKAAAEYADDAAQKLTGLQKALNIPKSFATSIWEEGFKENMVQSLVTPFVGAQAAEYISEFAFPSGSVNMLSNYMQSVQNVNYGSRSSMQNAAANIQRVFTEAGHNDVTVSVRQNAAGNFNIVVMSGFESSLQNRLSSLNTRISQTTEGGRVVASINSGGQIELTAHGIDNSDARNEVLADARTSIGGMLGISVDNSIGEIGRPITVEESVAQPYVRAQSQYFTDSADVQTFMMGAFNAAGQISDINAATQEDVEQIIAGNTNAVAEVRREEAPGVVAAFWNGDTRISTDMMESRMAVANVIHNYTSDGKFNIEKFRQEAAKIKTVENLNKSLNVLTQTILTQESGLAVTDIFTANDFRDALQAIRAKAATVTTKTGEAVNVNMQIAQFGAMLAQKGFASADMTNVLADSLGANQINEFGVTTAEQLNELMVYLAMIRQSTAKYRTFSERARNLFTFHWSEMGVQKVNSATTSLDNILGQLKQANSAIANIKSKLAKAETLEKRQAIVAEAIKNNDANRTDIGGMIMGNYLGVAQAEIQGEINRETIRHNIQMPVMAENYQSSAKAEALKILEAMPARLLANIKDVKAVDISYLTGKSVSEVFSEDSLSEAIGKVGENNGVRNISEIEINGVRRALTVRDLMDMDWLTNENMGDVSFTAEHIVLSFEHKGSKYEVNFSREDIGKLKTAESKDANLLGEKLATKWESALEVLSKEVDSLKAVHAAARAARQTGDMQSYNSLQGEISALEKESGTLDDLQAIFNIATGQNKAAVSADRMKAGSTLEGFDRVIDLSLAGTGEQSMAEAKNAMREVFKEMAGQYWPEFDAAIVGVFAGRTVTVEEMVSATAEVAKAIETAKAKEKTGEKAEPQVSGELAQKILEARKFIENSENNYDDVKWDDIKAALENALMKKKGYTDKTQFTYEDMLVLHLKFLESQIGVLTSVGKPVPVGKELAEAFNWIGNSSNNKFSGYGVLQSEMQVGKSTLDQALLVIQNHFGNITAVQAGGGKSLANYIAMGMYFDLHPDAMVAEYMGAGTNDTTQFVTSSKNRLMQRLLGLNVVNGSELYADRDFDAIAEHYNSQEGRTIIAFALGDRAFVEVEAAKNAKLNEALNNVAMRTFDEADVAALSTQSFINSGQGTPVAHETVDKLKDIYSEIKLLNATAVPEGTVFAKDALQYKYEDNAIVVSPALKNALAGIGIDIASREDSYSTKASQVMRAMHVMEMKAGGAENITFDENGQPGQAGSPGTKDQSVSYNVSLAIIAAENNIPNVDPYKITESQSDAEAIISAIARHHRSGKLALNAASSATMQDAGPIASVLYGGKVVGISASSMKELLEAYHGNSDKELEYFLGNISVNGEIWTAKMGEARLKVDAVNKERIVELGIKTAKEFLQALKNGGDATPAASLLFGAMDMTYNTNVMVGALAELYADSFENLSDAERAAKIREFTDEVMEFAKKSQGLSKTLDHIKVRYGASLSDYMGAINDIRVIDAQSVYESEEHAAVIAKKSKSRRLLVFTNNSGLRGVDYQTINGIILDGHNFTSSDLYQATGRPGRNKEWSKSSARIAVMMAGDSIQTTLEEIQHLNDVALPELRANGIEMQDLFPAGSREAVLLSRINSETNPLTPVEQLELVASFKSRQTQSSSILFKANQEISGILIKNPIVNMIRYANEHGLAEEAARLEKIYAGILAKNESNIFAQNSENASEYADPIVKLRETFKQELVQAREVFEIVKQTNNEYIQGQAQGFLNSINNFDFDSTLETQKAERTEATFVGVNSEIIFETDNPVQDLARVLIGLSENLLPVKNTMLELKQAVANEAVRAEVEKRKEFVRKVGEKIYITQAGRMFAALAEANVDAAESSNFSKVLGTLLALLLGGAGVPPEEKEEESVSMLNTRTVDLAKALHNQGITNINGVISLINSALWDSSVLDKITTAGQLKRIVKASHPQGFEEWFRQSFRDKTLPTAQSIELKRLADPKDDAVAAYDEVVEGFYKAKASQFALTVGERAQVRAARQEKFALEHPILATAAIIAQNIALLPLRMLSMTSRFAVMGFVGNILPFGGEQTSGMFAKAFNNFLSVATSDILMPSSKKGERTNRTTLADKAAAVVFKFPDIFNAIKNKRAVKRAVKNLDEITNPLLKDIASMENNEIKAKMNAAGIKIKSNTDKAIGNIELLENNAQDLFGKMRLSDISGLEKLTGLISLAETDKNFNLALDYDILKQIISGRRTVLDVYGQELAEKLVSNMSGIKDRLTAEEITVAMLKEATEEMGLDMGYVMALILPENSDNSGIISRYNAVKDTAYAQYIKVSDLNKDSNFASEGVMEEKYKKELLSVMPYGEVSNNDIKRLGYGETIGRAKEIVEKLGGSEEARKFVDRLSLGVLSDKKFGEMLIKLISKSSRDDIGIKSSEIYRKMALPGKINAIYQQGGEEDELSNKLSGLIVNINKRGIFSQEAVGGLYVLENFGKIVDFINGFDVEGADFTNRDIINSLEVLSVSDSLFNAHNINLNKVKFVQFGFGNNKDEMIFIIDFEGTKYAIDMGKDKGIVRIRDISGNAIWEAKGSKEIINTQLSDSQPGHGGYTFTITTTPSQAEESVYSDIHKLSNEKLQSLAADSGRDIAERFLAFLILKKQGVEIEVSDEMLAKAKQHLRDIETGEVKVITDEEKQKYHNKSANDRLRASLAMVYYIMLESYIGEFNVEQSILNGIWNDIYDNAEVVTSNSGMASSNFIFQPNALTPNIMAHEVLHNITNVYLGKDKNLTNASLAEFSSDLALITFCEKIGVEIPQMWKNDYREDSSYVKTGALPIEEHYLARGIIGLSMEMAAKTGASIDWNNMMSAVAQNLQKSDFMGFVHNNQFMRVYSEIMRTYFEIKLGKPLTPYGNLTEETTVNLYNMLKYYFSEDVIENSKAIQQPLPLSAANIATPLSVVNRYGMPALLAKVQSLVGERGVVVGKKEIEAALKNCAVDALTAMGRVTEINALSSLLADVILTQASPEVGLDYELAAGLGKDGKQIMLKDVRKNGRGLEYAVIEELDKLEKLQFPVEGVIGVLKKADEANLHLVNIRGVKDGMVRYIENGENKEATVEEFEKMGFGGLIMTDKATKRVNKSLLGSLKANGDQIRSVFDIDGKDKKLESLKQYKGVKKLADTIVDGVVEGEELNKAVLYALNIWKNTAEMEDALGLKGTLELNESDVNSDAGTKKITQGYYKKVSEALAAGEEGLLSPGEVMAEVKLLSAVRDMLIAANKDGKMKSLLNEDSLSASDMSNIMSRLVLSKAVNHNVLIGGLVSAKDDIKKDGLKKDDINIINVEKLKGAVEEKKGLKERLAGRFFGSGAKLEEVLPALGSDTFVNVRGTMHSPMMARALAAAA